MRIGYQYLYSLYQYLYQYFVRVTDALKDFSWENFHFPFFFIPHSFFYTSCRRRPPTLTTPPTPTPLHSHGHPCYVIRRTRNLGSKEAFLILDFVNVSLLLLSPKTLSEDFTKSCRSFSFFFLLLPLIMPHNERYPTLNSHRRYRHTNRTWFCCEAVRLFVGEFNYAVTFFRFLRFLLFSFLRFFYSTTVLGY